MNRSLKTASTLVVLLLGTALVQDGRAEGFAGPFWGWAGYYATYDAYVAEPVPYYVAHPPVRYAYSILNGVDPWHYARPMAVETSAPLVVINQHVQSSGSAKPAPFKRAPKPVKIVNPFVK